MEHLNLSKCENCLKIFNGNFVQRIERYFDNADTDIQKTLSLYFRYFRNISNIEAFEV